MRLSAYGVVTAALCAMVVVAAGGTSGIVFSPGPSPLEALLPDIDPAGARGAAESEPLPDVEQPARGEGFPFDMVVSVLVIGLVGGILVRSLLRRRSDGEPAPAGGRPPPGSLPLGASALDAVRSARHAITSSGTSRDGVIACWMALEGAAALAGRSRHPAATPAEFVAARLRDLAGPGQGSAVDTLLATYERVRFGGPVLADDATTASEALRTIESALDRKDAHP